jgi:hypothetical protein
MSASRKSIAEQVVPRSLRQLISEEAEQQTDTKGRRRRRSRRVKAVRKRR